MDVILMLHKRNQCCNLDRERFVLKIKLFFFFKLLGWTRPSPQRRSWRHQFVRKVFPVYLRIIIGDRIFRFLRIFIEREFGSWEWKPITICSRVRGKELFAYLIIFRRIVLIGFRLLSVYIGMLCTFWENKKKTIWLFFFNSFYFNSCTSFM